MRTLLDLANVLDHRLLELSVDRLWRRGAIDPRRFLAYLGDRWCMGRRGSAVLRELVRERLGQGPSGSDVETQLLQILRDANLPAPTRQHPVVTPFGVRYLDLAYIDSRVAIEVDGMAHRLDPKVFLDDRVRQNMIDGQGWKFRRFGYAHVTNDTLWTVFSIAEAMKLRPTGWTTDRR